MSTHRDSLQDDIQNELIRRGTADPEDSTMAEYVTVMLSKFIGTASWLSRANVLAL